MDAERARAFLLTLPHVVETEQWGDNLVFWVGDKAIGGKMFALVDLGSGISKGVVSYSAGPERYNDLLEIEGVIPAPYMARIHWVAAERWGVLRNAEWEDELRAAHAITLGKMTPKMQAVLALPAREQKRLISERRKLLAEREAAKKAAALKAARKR
jgi:predicted DNA-binding protein (MmcQ/YjbR family)